MRLQVAKLRKLSPVQLHLILIPDDPAVDALEHLEAREQEGALLLPPVGRGFEHRGLEDLGEVGLAQVREAAAREVLEEVFAAEFVEDAGVGLCGKVYD